MLTTSLTEITRIEKPVSSCIQFRSDIIGLPEAIVPDANQRMLILNHFQSIGADHSLLTNDNVEVDMGIMRHWYFTLVVDNDRFPSDIPINLVLYRFFRDVLHKKVCIKGFNLMAHVEAFHEWITTNEGLLREKLWQFTDPGKRPRELAPKASIDPETEKVNNQQRIKALESMYKNNIPDSIKRVIEQLEKEIQ